MVTSLDKSESQAGGSKAGGFNKEKIADRPGSKELSHFFPPDLLSTLFWTKGFLGVCETGEFHPRFRYPVLSDGAAHLALDKKHSPGMLSLKGALGPPMK